MGTLHNNYVFNLARLSYGTDNLATSYRRDYSSDKSKTFKFITEFRTKLPKKLELCRKMVKSLITS